MRPGSHSLVYFTLGLGFMLNLLPWSGVGLLLRPDFVLLVLLYWLIRAPHLCNIGVAWLMGMLMDLAAGSLFGQHALAYIFTAFLALLFQRRVTLFDRLQQAGFVFALLLVYQLMLLLLKLFSGADALGWAYFLPAVTGILLWQIVVYSTVKVSGDKS